MSTIPNPDRLAAYQARLADLLAERDAFRSQRNDHKVRLLNRQISAQRKWIKKARSTQLADRA